MSGSNLERRIKLTVVGDGDTGKTSMLVVYKDKKFDEFYIPTIKSCGNHVSDIIQNKPTNIHILCRFDSYSMNIEIRNDCYTVLMTDTAGQEEYDRLRPLGYPGTDVFVICFAVNNRISFNNVRYRWHPEVRHYCGQVNIVLAGTKSDTRLGSTSIVSSSEGELMKRLIKASDYIECSAKFNWNVDKVFHAALLSVINNKPERKKRKCAIL